MRWLCALTHKAIPTVMHVTENGSPSNHPWKKADNIISDCVLRVLL